MFNYKKWIEKYEGEIKGFQIMIRQEELNQHSKYIKQKNIEGWKRDLRKARYNLTRTKTLAKEAGYLV